MKITKNGENLNWCFLKIDNYIYFHFNSVESDICVGFLLLSEIPIPYNSDRIWNIRAVSIKYVKRKVSLVQKIGKFFEIKQNLKT